MTCDGKQGVLHGLLYLGSNCYPSQPAQLAALYMAAKLLKIIRSPQVMPVHLRVYVSLMQVQDTGIVWIILLCTGPWFEFG